MQISGCSQSYWDPTGILLGSLPLGSFLLEPYWDPTGILLGSYWDPTGIPMRSQWDPTGILLGFYLDPSYWDPTGILLGSYWALYWDPPGMPCWDPTGISLDWDPPTGSQSSEIPSLSLVNTTFNGYALLL